MWVSAGKTARRAYSVLAEDPHVLPNTIINNSSRGIITVPQAFKGGSHICVHINTHIERN